MEPTWTVSSGMSLRDYFAGHALVGLLQDVGPDCINVKDPEPERLQYAKDIARSCYRYADAMIVARKEPSNAKEKS